MDMQHDCDFLIAHASGDEAQSFKFAWRERVCRVKKLGWVVDILYDFYGNLRLNGGVTVRYIADGL